MAKRCPYCNQNPCICGIPCSSIIGRFWLTLSRWVTPAVCK
jgi:hypothetical protein